MIKVAGIIVNPTKKNWLNVTNSLIKFLVKRKRKVVMEPAFLANYPLKNAEGDEFFRTADIIISLGGDGTLLNAIRSIRNFDLPVFGVNLGGLGFLTEFTQQTLFNEIEKVLKNDYEVQKRMMLQGILLRDGKIQEKHVALNDFVISQRDLARLLTINTFVNDEYITTYQADGLIVCTPTGSTAYSLSAGGPIVEPDTDVILMTPICPHTLTNRPILLPPDSKIKIELPQPENEVALTIDGQIGITVRKGDVIELKRYSKYINLIKSSKSSFFQILRKKLGWGGSKGVQ